MTDDPNHCASNLISAGPAHLSEIGGLEASVLCDASEHVRPNLFLIMKREHEIRPAVPGQGTVRAGLSLEMPTRSGRGRRVRGEPWCPANGSRRVKRDRERLGRGFLMLEAFRQHTKRESLDMGYCLGSALSIAEGTRERRDLGDPPAVVLPLNLN